jgi:hypothetical protein
MTIVRCAATAPHPSDPPPAVMVMRGGTALCEPCAVVQATRAVNERRAISLVPIPQPDPHCLVCGAVCHMADDAWVCTRAGCGSEWYPDHDARFAVLR